MIKRFICRAAAVHILLTSAFLSVFAQDSTSEAAGWGRFKANEKNISIRLPRLPVLIKNFNPCRSEETSQYAAYSDEVAYVFSVTSESKREASYCRDYKKFDRKSFAVRVNEIKGFLKDDFVETAVRQGGLEGVKLANKSLSYYFYNDYENKRWIELTVAGDDETKPSVKAFVESLSFDQNAMGTEIGAGAARMMGDDAKNSGAPPDQDSPTNDSPLADVKNLRIVLKPRANYTDAARQNQVTGTVRVRVVFAANGGIESVAVMKSLPHGLTEQAVLAAQKIVFIPQKRNGKSVSVAKVVEYGFSIY